LLQRLSNTLKTVPQNLKTIATGLQQTTAIYGFKQRLYSTVCETQKTVAYRKGNGRIEHACKTIAFGYKYGF
jgi:hypothetical protein